MTGGVAPLARGMLSVRKGGGKKNISSGEYIKKGAGVPRIRRYKSPSTQCLLGVTKKGRNSRPSEGGRKEQRSVCQCPKRGTWKEKPRVACHRRGQLMGTKPSTEVGTSFKDKEPFDRGVTTLTTPSRSHKNPRVNCLGGEGETQIPISLDKGASDRAEEEQPRTGEKIGRKGGVEIRRRG